MVENIRNTALPFITSLTSLRFFAALMVLCSHLNNFVENCGNYALKNVMWKIFSEGYIGVTFFFILSGFILTYNYDHLVRKKTVTLKHFLLFRFARIYPTFLLTFLLAIPLFVMSLEETSLHIINMSSHLSYLDSIQNILNQKTISFSLFITTAIANLGLIQSFLPFSLIYFSFNAPAWSISDEAFFYLVCCLLLGFTKQKLLKIMALSFIILSTLGFFALHWKIKEPLIHWFFYINPLVRVFDFMGGILLAKIFLSIDKNKIKNGRLLFTTLELISLLALGIFFFIAVQYNINQAWRYDVFYLIPMSAIIFIFSFEKGYFSNLIKHRYFVFLGEISFSLYMFHQLIIRYLTTLLENFSVSISTLPRLLLFIMFVITSVIIISALNYLFYEKPLNRFIRHTFTTKCHSINNGTEISIQPS